MIEELGQPGESVEDLDDNALHIMGDTFEIHPETGVQEV